MRLVHLADTHLGFRQFARCAPNGVNQREIDVERTFTATIDKIIALAPDLVILGGDIFHVVRPSNHAVVNAFQEFERLAKALPANRIVMVAGNHDAPKTADTGGILGLFASLGIHVVDKGAARIDFDDLGLHVLAVPDVPGLVRPALTPSATARYNVMVLHGEVQGMLSGALTDRMATEIPADDLHAPDWNYIGLGHWHVYRELAPNMAYSGSIDYTSSNPWGEMAEEHARGVSGKGFVERDLDTGAQTFHALPASRPYLELPTFSAQGMTSTDIDAALRLAVETTEGGIEGKVVRVVITEMARDLVRGMDQRALREYRLRALNFHADYRRGEATRVAVSSGGRVSLEERLRLFLSDRVLPSDINRADLTALASRYLSDVTDPADNDTSLAELLEASLEPQQPQQQVA